MSKKFKKNELPPDHIRSPYQRGKRLKILRNIAGLTMQEISNKYNFGLSTLKYWENTNSGGLTRKGAEKFIDAMREHKVSCNVGWLFDGFGAPPSLIDIRHGNKNNKKNITTNQEIDLFCEANENAITILILDDGMRPFYTYGDSVGGKQLYNEDINTLIGKHCIVKLADKQVLCRRLEPGSQDNLFNICCINPQTSTYPSAMYNVNLVSAAEVIRYWKSDTDSKVIATLNAK